MMSQTSKCELLTTLRPRYRKVNRNTFDYEDPSRLAKLLAELDQ